MKGYKPLKPVGDSGFALFVIAIWEMLWNGKFPIRGVKGAKVAYVDGYYEVSADPSKGGSGGSGWKWQSPKKELDQTVAVAGPNGDTYTAVYLSPGNPLCTDGMLDLISGELVIAPPGIWMAAQAVPAQVTNPAGLPAGVYYNVPQLPYPGTTSPPTAPSGTPLAGDLDGSDVFWIQIEAYDYCANQVA